MTTPAPVPESVGVPLPTLTVEQVREKYQVIGDEDTVLKIALELKNGAITVDEAVPRLESIQSSSDEPDPALTRDKDPFEDIETDSWVRTKNDNNNPNRLYIVDLSWPDFKRCYTALVGELTALDGSTPEPPVVPGAPAPPSLPSAPSGSDSSPLAPGKG